MSETDRRDRLRRLALAAGAPGAESEVRAIVRATLEGTGELSYDRLGSILCERVGDPDGPRVVLDGHLDEVAFLVQTITAAGRLEFVPVGGWWSHVLLAQRVDVVTDDGRKIPGVVGSKPQHFLSPAEQSQVVPIDRMYIDIGASGRDEVVDWGIQLGDPIVPHTEFLELRNPDYLSCKAFDDRVGVGVMCEVMRELDRHPNTVVGVGAVQEEVGCRGAGTSSAISRPDVAIVLEGTPADDLPGQQDCQAMLGKGPQIRFSDPTALSNRSLVRHCQAVAARADIPVRLAVRRSGGTDAATIHRFDRGVATVVIGVPARYIHTHVSIVHWQDYENARRLVGELVRSLDHDTVESFYRYDQ